MRLLTVYNLISLSLLALVPQPTSAAVLAIDYGAEWIKASVMSPGVPFDVLLNKDSKRKIQASVGWKRGDRLFGTDAFNLASRFPTDSFNHLKYLQAVPFTSTPVAFFGQITTAAYFQNKRKTISFERSDGEQFSVEELIAMQFNYIKQLAESVAEEKVTDVIVTVPPFFTEFERNAVVDAIEIAGLRTLALINDGTAVAVNYAMNRNFQPGENSTAAPAEWHVVYDAGASAIKATVVGFSALTDKKGAVTGAQIQVAGVGYDRTVGGIELDRRLRDLFVERFAEKWGKDVRRDMKGMAKLWKEAGRIKHILSANNEATANVESVAWDLDFKTKVTRAEFEDGCADLREKFVTPLYDALNAAGLGLNDITSVILFGGSTRVPMIQSALRSVVGDGKIALNVNADEAAVMGAGLHGASLSRQFKTKPIKVSDIIPYDVQASYFAASTKDASRPRTITTSIFPAGTKTGTKKTLTFKRKEDFSIFFDYKLPPVPGVPARIMEVDIQGVAEALANLTERGAIDPVVKATLSLSESGFLSVSEAVAFGEIKDESITGKLKSFFGRGSQSSPTSSSEEEIQADNGASSAESTSESSTSASESASSASASASETPSAASPSPAAAQKKRDPSDNTIALKVNTRFTTIKPMSIEEKKEARTRLREINADEAAKVRREEARNTFEGYLYKLRDLLDDENETSPFKKCSTSDEREGISGQLEDSFLWLHEFGDVAETSQFLDKRIALETLERPIVHRYKEIEQFPQALNNSQMWNWSTRLFLAEARQNITAEEEAGLPSKWTRDELDSLEKTLKEHESWLGEWVEKQKKVKSWEDPVIETTEMKARAKVLEQQLQKLWKRKVPKTPKKKTTTTATETRTETVEATPTSTELPTEDGQQVPLEDHKHDEL